jgi:outer membrane protein assembly factor BamB
VIVGSVARGRGGLFAWDAMLGSELWRIERPKSIGVHAAAVLADSVAYYANAAGQVRAVELQTGDEIWAKSLFAGNSDWDYAITGTPALSDGRLFVPTQYDFLYALDAATGDELWRIRADDSVLHTSHARVIAQSFPGSPLVSGRYLYAGGADGLLRSLEVDTGVQLWSLQLGSPIMSGMAAAGDQLYVQSFDGTVRAMVHVDRPLPDPQDPDGGADDGGCGCSASSDQTPWSPLALALACWLAISAVRSRGGRARRRARSRARRCGP